MESLGNIAKHSPKLLKKPKKDVHLHSANHVLADELCEKLRDKKHFGLYLKMATTHDHGFLRKILGEILENKNATTPGRLFSYLVKKYNDENKLARNAKAQMPNDQSSPKT